MIRHVLLASFLCCIAHGSAAQAVVELVDDTEIVTVDDAHYLADRTGELTFDDILSGAGGFAPVSDTSFSADILTYWLTFTLENKARTQNRYILEFEHWLLVEVYAAGAPDTSVHPETGAIMPGPQSPYTALRTGRHVPFSMRDTPVANRNLISVTIPPRESQLFYARLHSDYSDVVVPANLSFRIYTPDALSATVSRTRHLLGLFTGVFLVLFLYNLFIYISVRDKNYLYYIMLMGFLLIVNEWNAGYFVEYLRGFENFVAWHGALDVLLSSVFGILLLLFTRSFLHLREEMPFWDRIAKGIMIALVVLPLPAFLGATFVAYNISSMIGLVTCAVILTVAVKSYRARFPAAVYFLLAYSFFLTGLAIFLLTDLGVLPWTPLSLFTIQFGSVAEGVLFSFALADRINVLREENQNLLTRANRDLEQKVHERTREIEHQKEELAAQRDHVMSLNDELATANEDVRMQAEKIETAYHELEHTHARLKETQVQLVHREKLASLGELAAGIAHEVKNPLNFVNNFSELSIELVDEFEEELGESSGGGVEANAASLKEMFAILKTNLAKIRDHGRRADGIVRSMLEHSRGVKGESRAVDVNALVEEYLNLSVHGMRARIPDFNADVERDYDDSIGAMELVPQEIGRVLLNLLNNAFYEVLEKAAQVNGSFRPAVTVRTRARAEGGVEIRVEDNGRGISEEKSSKIFQPFFTTKPTGEGTGLGLSLSHEIVTQMHGGSLSVEQSDSGGAAFVVQLPQARPPF